VGKIDVRSVTVMVLLAALSGACRRPAEPAPERARPAAQSRDAIPEGPVSGYVRDEPFAVQRAVYSVDRRNGYERIDIKLYSKKIDDPCRTVPLDEGPTVWIRRRGAGELEPGTVRIAEGDPGPWEVHYQIRDGTAWEGNGDAAALLVLSGKTRDGKIRGELSASFGDRWSSRVVGSFSASECPIAIDSPVRGIAGPERAPRADGP
jgi:hypothetical protein